MKSLSFRIFLIAAVVLTVASIPAFTQSNRMRADIPFPFQAGEKVLPAGTYDVEVTLDKNRMSIRQLDGNAAVWLSTGSPADPAGNGSALLFHRYGSNYFLRQVDAGSLAYAVPKTRNEREMARTINTQLAYIPIWSR